MSRLFVVAFFIAAVAGSVLGCQTSRFKEFESIQGGMSKDEVLAKIGNPDRTQRWHGRDRWQYTLYGHPEGDLVREVHFEEGRSTYIGPAIKPAVSADAQDHINDVKNRAADARDSGLIVNEPAEVSDTSRTAPRFVPVQDDDDDTSASQQ